MFVDPLAGSFCQSMDMQTGDLGFGTPQGGNIPAQVKGDNKESREEISKGRGGQRFTKWNNEATEGDRE